MNATLRWLARREIGRLKWRGLAGLALIVFAAVWSVSPGDPLGFGAWVTRVTGYDVLAARGWNEAVAKPAVSAASFETRRVRVGDAEAGAWFDGALKDRRLFVARGNRRHFPDVLKA